LAQKSGSEPRKRLSITLRTRPYGSIQEAARAREAEAGLRPLLDDIKRLCQSRGLGLDRAQAAALRAHRKVMEARVRAFNGALPPMEWARLVKTANELRQGGVAPSKRKAAAKAPHTEPTGAWERMVAEAETQRRAGCVLPADRPSEDGPADSDPASMDDSDDDSTLLPVAEDDSVGEPEHGEGALSAISRSTEGAALARIEEIDAALRQAPAIPRPRLPGWVSVLTEEDLAEFTPEGLARVLTARVEYAAALQAWEKEQGRRASLIEERRRLNEEIVRARGTDRRVRGSGDVRGGADPWMPRSRSPW
jgi:hypothetical protein